jgi:imidazolonepropionase-like amidohydrolase
MGLFIDGVRVFDGRAVHGECSVLVRDGFVVDVGGRAGSAVERLDGRGLTLLPGLIDAHTHVYPGQLEQALAFGVTTELDMFADPLVVASLKRQAAASMSLADVRSAGTGATAPGGHPCQLASIGAYPAFPTVGGPADAEAFVAQRQAEGSDYLKVFVEPGGVLGTAMPALDAATVTALVAAGHRAGLLVVAHATDRVSAELALASGVDGLAHVVLDEPPSPDMLARVGERGLFAIPTLAVLEAICGRFLPSTLLSDDRVAPYLSPLARMMLENAAWPEPTGWRPDFGVALAWVAALRGAGATILAGTDAGSPGAVHGASLHRELGLLVEAGLSPVEALTAATAAPAEVFGLSDRGRIAAGLIADLLLVRGDPTTDIKATSDIVAVWRGGVRVDRAIRPAEAGP